MDFSQSTPSTNKKKIRTKEDNSVIVADSIMSSEKDAITTCEDVSLIRKLSPSLDTDKSFEKSPFVECKSQSMKNFRNYQNISVDKR